MAQRDVYPNGACYNDCIVALATVHFRANREKIRHVGKFGISIHPEFHNNGLGTRMLVVLEELSKEKGLLKLEAEFSSSNKAAQHVYILKLGYTIEGFKTMALRLENGSFDNDILIGKIFT